MKYIFKKILYTLFIVFVFCFSFNFSSAATCSKNPAGITTVGIDVLSNPNDCPDFSSEGDSLPSYAASQIKIAVTVILGFTSTIALIAFVYAGVIILNSKGKPDKFKEGQNIITYTFIGIIIIIFSYAAANFLLTTVPKITGGGSTTAPVVTSSSSVCYTASADGNYLLSATGECMINGVGVDQGCAGDEEASLGKCKYIKETYILDANGFPSSLNLQDNTCGRNGIGSTGASDKLQNFCKTIDGTKYCLRCVKN